MKLVSLSLTDPTIDFFKPSTFFFASLVFVSILPSSSLTAVVVVVVVIVVFVAVAAPPFCEGFAPSVVLLHPSHVQ